MTATRVYSMLSTKLLGLSFGNTNSSIAYIKEGLVEVIANQDGDRAIPSMLSYAHNDEFHGVQAKHQIVRNSANTIGFFRDYVGLKFQDIDVSAVERTAKPVAGPNGEIAFEINGEIKLCDEILERHFTRLHDSARDYIGREIDGVVLALPFGYPEAQRTKLAAIASKAGLSVKSIIGELSAALLAHISREDLSESNNEDKLVCVADLGGTRSDAALISVNSGIFTVLASHSDLKLGGKLLDEAVLNYMAKEFQQQYNVDPRSDPRGVAKLVLEAESIRKTLSNSTSTQFGIDSVSSGYDFSGSLNRLKYEVLARAIFSKFSSFISTLLEKASVDPLQVQEVLLIGGVSWTPKIAATIGSLFDDKYTKIVSPSTDTKAIDPDELIARGCAIQSSLIAGLDADELSGISSHLTGTQLSKAVGVKIGEVVVPILGAHSLAPTKKTVEVEASDSSLQIVELVPEIKSEVHKPEPKAAEDENDDDDSDWGDSEDEDYEVRSLVWKPTNTLAEVSLQVEGKAKVTLYFTAAHKLQVVATSGGKSVQGTV